MSTDYPAVIQSLWIGESLSTFEILTMQSYLYHGHPFHLYAYHDIPGVPDGVQVMNANEILSEELVFVNRSSGSLGSFADWFRYELLAKKQGYWVDMDQVCLRPFEFHSRYVFGWGGDVEQILNGVLKLPPDSPGLQILLTMCRDINTWLPFDRPRKKLLRTLRWLTIGNRREFLYPGEVGPVGMTRMVNHLGLQQYIQQQEVFYPVSWSNWRSIYDDRSQDGYPFLDTSYSVHLWNEAARAEKIDKDATYPAGSLIERLKRMYLR